MTGPGRQGRRPGAAPGRALGYGLLLLVLGFAVAIGAAALAGWWEPGAGEEVLADPAPTFDPASVRVEVLNGAGTAGLARQATMELRDAGFDVVYYGNADRFDHERSVVLDRRSETDRARAVAWSLGIDSVAALPDSSLLLEVTVVLGDDWPPGPASPPGWTERLHELIGDGG